MIYLWLLILLLGCQQRSAQWACQHIKEKASHCTRLLYSSEDHSTGIDVEILQIGDELSIFLQVHAYLQLSADHTVQVILHCKDKHLTFLVPCHKGQQRIHLSPSLREELTSLLHDGHFVTIELEGYRETLDPISFQKAFQALRHPPFPKLIQLPF